MTRYLALAAALLTSPALAHPAMDMPPSGLSGGSVLLAQIPKQGIEPAQGEPDWQRPNADVREYTAAAKQALEELAEKVAELRQRANEQGRRDLFRELETVQDRLRIAWENWDKLPQAAPVTWDTVRKEFEMAYEDLMKAWNEVQRNF